MFVQMIGCSYHYGRKGAAVETNCIGTAGGFEQPNRSHDEAVTTDGLEDLFKWASNLVADGEDSRAKRSRELRIRRRVLDLIHSSKDLEAHAKYAEELSYLQRRVIALLQSIQEKTEEVTTVKQIMVAQYFALQQIPALEQEVKQLKAMTWYREEAEAERKQLMTTLQRMKKERDFLDELVTINENENSRLMQLLVKARAEANELKNRRWWHPIRDLFMGRTTATG